MAAVINKNKRYAAGNSGKVVHPWFKPGFLNLAR